MWASGRSPGASPRPGPASGFTLIEILLAAALIVSLTTIALPWFGRAIGRYRWHWVAASAIAIPALLYFVFETFFRVALPKSIWYTLGLPF